MSTTKVFWSMGAAYVNNIILHSFLHTYKVIYQTVTCVGKYSRCTWKIYRIPFSHSTYFSRSFHAHFNYCCAFEHHDFSIYIACVWALSVFIYTWSNWKRSQWPNNITSIGTAQRATLIYKYNVATSGLTSIQRIRELLIKKQVNI